MGTALTTVPLPVGLDRGGVLARTAALVELTGAVELRAASARGKSARERARALLLAAVAEVGGMRASPEILDQLTLGDRDAILLHLRRASIGERMSAVVRCPAASCGQKLDVDLTVGELLAAPAASPAATHEVKVDEGPSPVTLTLRLPTMGDMEALAAAPPSDAPGGDALSRLLGRCVLAARDAAGAPIELPSIWPAAWIAALSTTIEAHDPQAEIRIALTCPHCGAPFETVLDVADYVTREVLRRADTVLRDVHTLAITYHWSEGEILALPTERRAYYLGLLAEMSAGEERSLA